jgi:hypothetical protein
MGSETRRLTLVAALSAASWSSLLQEIESARLKGTLMLSCGGGDEILGGGDGDDSLEGEDE